MVRRVGWRAPVDTANANVVCGGATTGATWDEAAETSLCHTSTCLPQVAEGLIEHLGMFLLVDRLATRRRASALDP